MKTSIKAYAIFNITKNQYIFISPEHRGGRRFYIYGDLASARRTLSNLQKYDYKDDQLRIVELIPNEDWKKTGEMIDGIMD